MPIVEGVEFGQYEAELVVELLEFTRGLVHNPQSIYEVTGEASRQEIRAAIHPPSQERAGKALGVFLRIANTGKSAVLRQPKQYVDIGPKQRILTAQSLADAKRDIFAWHALAEKKFALKDSLSGAVRNPKWTRDELILALDLYFRTPPWTINGKHTDVIALSQELGKLAAYTDAPDKLRYRNPNGVYMKLMNLQFHDPARDGRGLKGGGALEKEIWEEFGSDQTQLTKVAAAIRAGANSEELKDTDRWLAAEDQAVEEAVEGRVLTRMHQVRERDSKLPAQKKHHVLKTTGALNCEGCKFNFKLFYGDHAGYYAEVHHLTPLSELPEHTTTTLSDLAVVCSNCHRMIHRRKRWLTMQELRDIIEQAKLVKSV